MQVMKFDLSDEQAAALTEELSDIIENNRWPFSPRIWMLKSILAKLRPGAPAFVTGKASRAAAGYCSQKTAGRALARKARDRRVIPASM
jgi:hypothetical protein